MQRQFAQAGLPRQSHVVAFVGGSQAQTPPAAPPPQPPQFPNMTFFVTSVGGPQGANFGGLEGADRHCQTLAAKAGAGSKTWRAYLSTQAVGGATGRQCQGPHRQGPVGQRQGRADRRERRRPALGQQQDRSRHHRRRNRPPDPEPALHRQPARRPDRLAGRRHRVPAGQGHDLRQLDQERRRQRDGRPRRPHGPARRRCVEVVEHLAPVARLRRGVAWWRPAAPACSTASRRIETPASSRARR